MEKVRIFATRLKQNGFVSNGFDWQKFIENIERQVQEASTENKKIDRERRFF